MSRSRRPRRRARRPRRWAPSLSSATSTARRCASCASGPTSLEFCGGTHVDSLGQIGSITLVSEGSIGSNTRRIFALTGLAVVGTRPRARTSGAGGRRVAAHRARRVVGRHRPAWRSASVTPRRSWAACASSRVKPTPKRWPRRRRPTGVWSWPAATRWTGMTCGHWPRPILRHDGVRAVVLGGSPDGAKAAIAGGDGRHARRHAAGADPREDGRRRRWRIGRGGDCGGKDPSQIEAALAEAQRLLSA